jgi:pimeloyl-ACP methyl ester carboxylesterase
MGGGIGQRLALDHDDRVASLTTIACSPALRPGGWPGGDLPEMSDELKEYFATPTPDGNDRTAVIDHILTRERLFAAGTRFAATRMRNLVARVVDRSNNIAASLTNYGLIDPGEEYRERLGEIAAPMLVIHGVEDPLFPFAHAEALAREVPTAELMPLSRVGHQAPPPKRWAAVVEAMLAHTRDRSAGRRKRPQRAGRHSR